ncbi:MAG TPA: cupredoxin domain-containing protein [Actinomycetota bacterium]|nr:cupredoxin domain-containing protein [Actinomycetota bacterium]
MSGPAMDRPPSRAPLALLIPVGGMLAIGVAAVGFSRILLSVEPEAATATALTVAFGIMAVAALVARRERIRAGVLLSYVGAVVGIAMVAGGIALAVMAKGTEAEGEAPREGEGPAGGGVVLSLAAGPGAAAEGFAQTQLTAPAGQPFTIRFENQDGGTPHNVAVHAAEDFSDPPIAATPVQPGPVTQTLEVPALDPGTYYFRCDVHPTTMTGTIEVQKGGAPAGGQPGAEGPAPAGVQVSAPPGAAGTGFAETQLTAPAGQPFTIRFENQDAGIPHNLAVYREEDFSGPPIAATPVEPGPVTQTLEVPALDPGTYYFRCDVHPTTMTGRIEVG